MGVHQQFLSVNEHFASMAQAVGVPVPPGDVLHTLIEEYETASTLDKLKLERSVEVFAKRYARQMDIVTFADCSTELTPYLKLKSAFHRGWADAHALTSKSRRNLASPALV